MSGPAVVLARVVGQALHDGGFRSDEFVHSKRRGRVMGLTEPPGVRPVDEPNPYLQPLSPLWSRAVGAVLLAVMVGLTLLIGYATLPHIFASAAHAPFNSSTLIFLLMLLVAWGFCWQAGWRLLLGRGGEPGSLFSWLVWLAIGVVLLTLTALMAWLLLAAGRPSGRELYLLLSMACLGGWCLWFAWQRRAR